MRGGIGHKRAGEPQHAAGDGGLQEVATRADGALSLNRPTAVPRAAHTCRSAHSAAAHLEIMIIAGRPMYLMSTICMQA